MYCFKATDAKLSEYQFKYSVYNSELLKALRNALKFNSIKSVHDISNKENRPDQEEILKELTLFVNDWLTAQKSYPARGIVNCSYDEMKKYSNKAYTENTNKKVWRKS